MAASAQTLSTLAVRYLRERIANGTLRPGAKLSDLVLSREIGISRTPIREALRLLAADGLVEVVPHQGATVRAPSFSELDELYEIRGLLEAHAAARAATARSPAEAAELLALSAAMDAVPAPAPGERLSPAATSTHRELDLAFHRKVLALSGLARLQRLVEDTGVIARPFENLDPLSGEQLRAANEHHRVIARAIADGDAERARQIMATHIASGREGLRARMSSWHEQRHDPLPAALRPFAS